MPTINELTETHLRRSEIFLKIQELGAGFIVKNKPSKAVQLAMVLEKRLSSSNLQRENSSLFELYKDLIVKMKLFAFELLGEEEAAGILRDHFSKFTDIQMNWEMALARFMFSYGFGGREKLRRVFKQAIEQNQEFIGHKKVSEWLAEYNRAHDFRKRTSLNTREFIAQYAGGLDVEERVKLKTLFFIYDYYLLVTPVVPAYELPIVNEYMEQGKLPDALLGGPDLPLGQSIAAAEDYALRNPFQAASASSQKRPGLEGNTINLRK